MRLSALRIQLSIIAASLTGAVVCFTALGGTLHAGEAHPAPEEYTAKNCEQIDTAWLAIRACTALLNRADIDSNARNRFHRSRGMAWHKEEEPKEALADFTRALELDATDLIALTGRARANAALGDHTAAVRDWTRAIEQSRLPNSDRPESIDKMYLERGSAWLATGNTDAALADYAKALEINPKNTAAHIARANTYFKLNDRERMLGAFESAAKIDPYDIRTYIARGEAAERWGDTRLAIESYMIAAKTNPRGSGQARQALKRLGVDKMP